MLLRLARTWKRSFRNAAEEKCGDTGSESENENKEAGSEGEDEEQEVSCDVFQSQKESRLRED